MSKRRRNSYDEYEVHHNYGLRIIVNLLKWTLILIVTLILYFLAVDANLFGLFGTSPTYNELQDPTQYNYVASEVYSADNEKLIGKFYQENRSPVSYDNISPIIIRALICTEDSRFYQHGGVDVKGLLSALKDMTLGHGRGASTITQQLAKNLFATRRGDMGILGDVPGLRILIAKSKEWIVAIKLESIYTKEEILEMYLNTVDFGNNSFGIKTACDNYFNTTPDKVTYEQAATLIGLLKATTTYNPRINYDRCLERRNTVLNLMYNQKAIVIDGNQITAEEFDSIQSIPILLADPKSESEMKSNAPYYKDALIGELHRLWKEGKLPFEINPYKDGVKIYTSLDTRLQAIAEKAVARHMTYIQQNFRNEWGNTPCWRDDNGNVVPQFIENLAKKTPEYQQLVNKYGDNKDSINYYLNRPHPGVKVYGKSGTSTMSTMDSIRWMVTYMHCGFIAIEPNTRLVRAWVGDIDYDAWKYDKVTSKRQPGSTFKLFVYTEAMRQGFKPTDTMVDMPHEYSGAGGKTWTPRNAGGGYSGASLPLRTAFAKSVNSIAVELGMKCGINNIIHTAHDMGIKSELQPVAPLCLGASDVSLFEMVNAYCTIADDGIYKDPVMITRIEDHEGNLIFENKPHETQAIGERFAAMMQRLLEAGTEPGGTSARIWEYLSPETDVDIGGKTGTTNNHSDAWYMGVTPGLVGGVWVGGEYRAVHFRSGSMGQGAKAAMPIWGYFIGQVMSDNRFPQYKRRWQGTSKLDPTVWGSTNIDSIRKASVVTTSQETTHEYHPQSTPVYHESEGDMNYNDYGPQDDDYNVNQYNNDADNAYATDELFN